MGFALGPGCSCCGSCSISNPRDYCKTATITFSGISGALLSCFGRINGTWNLYPLDCDYGTNVCTWNRTWYRFAPNSECNTDHSCFHTVFTDQLLCRVYTKLSGVKRVVDYVEMYIFNDVSHVGGTCRWYCDGDSVFTRDIIYPGSYAAWTNANIDYFAFNDASPPCFYADGMDDSIYAPDYDLTSSTVHIAISGGTGPTDYDGTYDLPFSSESSDFFYSLTVDTGTTWNVRLTPKMRTNIYTSCHPTTSPTTSSGEIWLERPLPAGVTQSFNSYGAGWYVVAGPLSGTCYASFV